MAQTGIRFEHGTWAEALKKAEKEKKMVFMDAFADWCKPCKWMAENAFMDPEVAEYFNDKFVNVKMDMEKGEGVALAQQYTVTAYPTLLFIRPDGNLHFRSVGALEAGPLLQLAQGLLDPQFVSLEDVKREILAAKKPDLAKIRKYVLDNIVAGNQNDTIFAIYRPYMQGEELLKPENFGIFDVSIFGHDDPEVRYVFEHRKRFQKAFPEKNIDEILMSRLEMNAILEADMDHMEGRIVADSLVERMKELKHPDLEKEILYTRSEIHRVVGELDEYAELMDQFIHKYEMDDNLLNNAAYTFASEVSSEKLLLYALKWIDKSISVQDNYYKSDSKAYILHKLGRRDEAIAMMRKAIQMGKEAGEDVKPSESLLEDWLKEGK